MRREKKTIAKIKGINRIFRFSQKVGTAMWMGLGPVSVKIFGFFRFSSFFKVSEGKERNPCDCHHLLGRDEKTNEKNPKNPKIFAETGNRSVDGPGPRFRENLWILWVLWIVQGFGKESTESL